MSPNAEFLTLEECAEVDRALLTSHDKFTARVTIYALRSLKQIAHQHNLPIATLQPAQIEDWVYQDPSLQQGIDQEFQRFFSHLVISSFKPLQRLGQELDMALEELTVSQVVAWFEKEGKAKMGQTP